MSSSSMYIRCKRKKVTVFLQVRGRRGACAALRARTPSGGACSCSEHTAWQGGTLSVLPA